MTSGTDVQLAVVDHERGQCLLQKAWTAIAGTSLPTSASRFAEYLSVTDKQSPPDRVRTWHITSALAGAPVYRFRSIDDGRRVRSHPAWAAGARFGRTRCGPLDREAERRPPVLPRPRGGRVAGSALWRRPARAVRRRRRGLAGPDRRQLGRLVNLDLVLGLCPPPVAAVARRAPARDALDRPRPALASPRPSPDARARPSPLSSGARPRWGPRQRHPRRVRRRPAFELESSSFSTQTSSAL